MRIFFLMFFSLSLLGFGFLQPDEAFKPKITQINKDTIGIDIDLGENIYLYKNKIRCYIYERLFAEEPFICYNSLI